MISLHLVLFCFADLGAAEKSHPFYLLDEKEIHLKAAIGLYFEEHEFEKAGVIQDLFENEHWSQNIEGLFKLHGPRQIGLGFSFQAFGKLKKEYSPTLGLPSESISYGGFHAATLFFQEHLQTKNEKNKMAIELRLKGSPLAGRERTNTYSGLDVSLSYLYSHQHDEWLLYGDLQADVIGAKKIRKNNGEKEIINAYSRFGNLIGLQWKQQKFWINLEGLFFLTTDYNSNSPSYTRLTDKGYVVGGTLLFGHTISPDLTITLSHTRHSSVFNVITESTTDGTEFEVEVEHTQLEGVWSF